MISIQLIYKTLKHINEQDLLTGWVFEFFDEVEGGIEGVDVACFFSRKSVQVTDDDWGDSFLHYISFKELDCGKVRVNCESLDLAITI